MEIIAPVSEIPVRDMDRAAIKGLRAAGLDPAFVEMDAQKTSDMIDWILDNVYADTDFAGVAYYKLSDLAIKTYRKAVGGPEAIKN